MSESPPAKRSRSVKAVVADSDAESDYGNPPSSVAGPSRRRGARQATTDDTDLDALDSDADEPNKSPRRVKGKQKAVRESTQEVQNGVTYAISQEDDDDLDLLDEMDDEESLEEEEGEEEEEVEAVEEGIRPEYERDDDGYVKGSIVRIKVKNFMTYDHVEFRPGPHLNMILGPNGTGKSSIAAALAVGLGFHPKVMGRAPDLKSYVKQGCEEAQTEVEIKGGRGERNTVLHCTFGRENDRTVWRMNGEPAKSKAITQAVADFGVQANNLCCFLPQDKVAEFARLTPNGVLTETMRAAGDPRLSKWHKTLSEQGVKRKELIEVIRKDTSDRDRLSVLVGGMTGEVERLERRQELETEVAVQSILRRILLAKRASDHFDEALVERRTRKRRLDLVEASREPITTLLRQYKTMNDQAHTAFQEARSACDDAKKAAQRLLDKITRQEAKVEDAGIEIKQIKIKLERRAKERKEHERALRNAQAILDEPEGSEKQDFDALSVKKKTAGQQVNTVNRQLEDGRHELREVQTRAERIQADHDRLFREHQQLVNIDQRREKDARDWDPSIAYALDWLQENEAALFEQPVIRPACMSVNVTNQALVKQLEACTNQGQRKTFICTTQADFEQMLKFSKTRLPAKYRGGDSLALHFMRIEVDDKALRPTPPCSRETLQALGFEGFAIDYVQAPDPMIAFLNRLGFSRTAVTSRPSSQINDQAALDAGLMQWVCRDDITSAKRSAYGRRDVQSSTRMLLPPRSWLLTVDNNAVRELSNKMADAKREKQTVEETIKERMEEDNKLRREQQKHRDEFDSLKTQMEAIRDKVRKRRTAADDVKAMTKKLAEDTTAPLVAQRDKINALRKENIRSRIPLIADCMMGCDALFRSSETLIETALGKVHRRENEAVISRRSREGEDELVEAKQLLKDQDRALNQARAEAADLHEQVKVHYEPLSDDARARVGVLHDNLREMTLEGVEDALEQANTDLALSEGIAPDVKEKYDRYKAELEGKTDRVEDRTEKLNLVQRDIAAVQRQFDPALNALIKVVNEKFSQSFERVGCTGEVRLNRESDDFAKWGIEIAVSYRDGDELAILTASRQSGGERSLATITYLMSLTEMARTPFSLVDEINQGMDQRAERNVHNQLVQVTCGENAGQYFLITPKLLTDLEYHPRMRVLNVVNGTHVPVNNGKKRKLHWADTKAVIRATKKSMGAGLIKAH